MWIRGGVGGLKLNVIKKDMFFVNPSNMLKWGLLHSTAFMVLVFNLQFLSKGKKERTNNFFDLGFDPSPPRNMDFLKTVFDLVFLIQKLF